MVRAILAGRKTQTRRIVKWGSAHMHGCSPMCCGADGYDTVTDRTIIRVAWTPKTLAMLVNPYGQPGDRLWVRENWQAWDRISHEYDEAEPWDKDRRGGLTFAQYYAEHGRPHKVTYEADPEYSGPWNPSIHMPRWASRITLEITGVRVERLQEISGDDAIQEGIGPAQDDTATDEDVANRTAYAGLWEQINGPGSWNANPLVWVVEFKRVTP